MAFPGHDHIPQHQAWQFGGPSGAWNQNISSNPHLLYSPSTNSSSMTSYFSFSPFPNSISTGIPAPPWQWWTRPGTSPWGGTWAQRLSDASFVISMNERMIWKHVEESFLFLKHRDVNIICGDTTFATHKVVICHPSRYFQAAFHGKFRESCGTLTLDDKDPILVEKVLEYLYTGNYTLEPDEQETEENDSDDSLNSALDGKSRRARWDRAQKKRRFGVNTTRPKERIPLYEQLFHSAAYFHLRMYAEADYFMIEGLKAKAETNFCQAFERLLTFELIFKREYNARFALSKIISELYSRRRNYGMLREMVLELMLNNMLGLRQTIFMSPMGGCHFLSSHPEFAADFCWGMMEKAFPFTTPDPWGQCTYYPTLMPEQFAFWERQCRARTGRS